MKKVLIIAYYWPPSGGSGVQRWLKFSKYLPRYNWKPIVYTPENPDFSIQDSSLEKDIPKEVTVLKRPIWEPYSWYKKFLKSSKAKVSNSGVVDTNSKSFFNYVANWIRGNVFIPDPKVYWVKPSVNYLSKYLNKNRIDAIISTGTPHSMHLIALALSKEFKIPWIADFRDPWSQLDMLDSYHITLRNNKKYEKLEKSVLNQANVSITTSWTWANDFKKLGATRVETITNGYDETDFTQKNVKNEKFVISHFGLMNHLRSPKLFFKALNEAAKENNTLLEDLEIHLGGTIDPNIRKEIESYHEIKKKVVFYDYLSHPEVIDWYHKSSILLLLLFNSESGKGNIPGKVFEYLATQKAIIAFGPQRGDAYKIMEETSNSYFEYDQVDINSLKDEILTIYKNWKTNEYSENIEDIKKYSRRNLTRQLANILEEITS